nr:MAG TPA: hypothetical protein [Caudoviricetes sp.]
MLCFIILIVQLVLYCQALQFHVVVLFPCLLWLVAIKKSCTITMNLIMMPLPRGL